MIAGVLWGVVACQAVAVGDALVAPTSAWFEARLARETGLAIPVAAVDALERAALRAWARAERDPTWLRDEPRLAALFGACFAYPQTVGDGELRPWPGVEDVLVRVPVGYRADRAHATLVVVFDAASESRAEAEARAANLAQPGWILLVVPDDRLIGLVREQAPTQVDALQAAGLLAAGLTWCMRPTPLGIVLRRLVVDSLPRREPGVEERDQRRGLFALLGAVQRRLNIDRDRLMLVGSARATGVALRAVATAPDRFAALALWRPVAVPAGELRNAALVPIAVVAGPGSAAAEGTRAELVAAGAVVRGMASDAISLTEWLGAQRRGLFRRRVAFVMESDSLVDGFWVQVVAAEFSVPGGREARIEASVDRSANAIAIATSQVETFTLLLNDALVDLDRPLVVDINGVVATIHRVRNVRYLLESVYQRFDPAFVFTTALTFSVPRRD